MIDTPTTVQIYWTSHKIFTTFGLRCTTKELCWNLFWTNQLYSHSQYATVKEMVNSDRIEKKLVLINLSIIYRMPRRISRTRISVTRAQLLSNNTCAKERKA